jgi:threonine/homoserine efflux transporter RhtA
MRASAQSLPGSWGENRRHDELQHTKEVAMNITLSLAPLVSLLAGVLILIAPRMLNYIVAIYLIVVGVLGLFGDIRLR